MNTLIRVVYGGMSMFPHRFTTLLQRAMNGNTRTF